MFTKKSDLADHPGTLVFPLFTVAVRQGYRRAFRIAVTPKVLPETDVPLPLSDEQLSDLRNLEISELRLFWGALAMMDRSKTTIEALLNLAPGCPVGDIPPSLYDFVVGATNEYVAPKKTTPKQPKK